ncbi:MAG: serine/threonine-protein kinase [Myxococcota bacterium]
MSMPDGSTTKAGAFVRKDDIVGGYRLLEEIARGGMGVIYAVQRESMGGFDRLLAMKLLLPELRSERQFIDMFLDEARIVSQVSHGNVVNIFDVGEHAGVPYFVMELLRGRSLSQLIRATSERLPAHIAAEILGQVCRGLHAAHQARAVDGTRLSIIHRDISPHNIFVGFDGLVRVIDFGIARADGRVSKTRTGEIRGKLAYMAPEQIDRSVELDRRADVWALGVVAWELFCGRRLFCTGDDASTMFEVLEGEIEPIDNFAPALPAGLSRAVMRALSRERDDRPAGCDELANVFEAAAQQLASSTPTPRANSEPSDAASFPSAEMTRSETLTEFVQRILPDAADADEARLRDALKRPAQREQSSTVDKSTGRPRRSTAAFALPILLLVGAAGAGGWALADSSGSTESLADSLPSNRANAPEPRAAVEPSPPTAVAPAEAETAPDSSEEPVTEPPAPERRADRRRPQPRPPQAPSERVGRSSPNGRSTLTMDGPTLLGSPY